FSYNSSSLVVGKLSLGAKAPVVARMKSGLCLLLRVAHQVPSPLAGEEQGKEACRHASPLIPPFLTFRHQGEGTLEPSKGSENPKHELFVIFQPLMDNIDPPSEPHLMSLPPRSSGY